VLLVFAQAVADYALAEADANTNPAKAQVWPVVSKALRQAVDDAYDTLKTEGAEKIEAALDTIKSVGGSSPRHARTLRIAGGSSSKRHRRSAIAIRSTRMCTPVTEVARCCMGAPGNNRFSSAARSGVNGIPP
jgi:hypothetical protein